MILVSGTSSIKACKVMGSAALAGSDALTTAAPLTAVISILIKVCLFQVITLYSSFPLDAAVI
ncbi:hypothetical protein, partial [Mesorhizobium sp. M7A.F.Ca.CA.002.15.2.1]|uniref:hypothetical protein n=1 Tax=Mesorhizobium sp. M7A.F.Ca.CA.002.15.2.1 TaxID=2496678 RepID=UPI001FE17E7A